ncbi:MAG TPA: glycine cleavage T C-terminal barrel domain-containing protein [Verrucomicrobiae bacterium]
MLALHDFHAARGAQFSVYNGAEAVTSYGSSKSEYNALASEAALIDLSFRSRICLVGSDREKFLHGQVTNDVQRLKVGEGTYAALVTHKGKLETDLFIYKLQDELLLDFEPGLTQKITDRLSKYIIAEDVQIIDVAPHYTLLSVQGPRAAEVLSPFFPELPTKALTWTKTTYPNGDLYLMSNGRFGPPGFDLFVPTADTNSVAEKLASSIKPAGLNACEIARIENGIPRFGIDMDESNLAPEALRENAISYAKGCYIGQEVIARIRTYGQVAKALRLIRLPDEPQHLPTKAEKLFHNAKEVGFITSSTLSPKHGAKVALAYVRKEANSVGQSLNVATPEGPLATIISA